jgi:hypothetical protein
MLDLQEARSIEQPAPRRLPSRPLLIRATTFSQKGSSYALDAQTGEVSQEPARQSQRQCFTHDQYRFRCLRPPNLERAWITNTQIEAARVALTRNMKRKGKLWIRMFPDKSVTARPPETRMGKG